MGAQRKSSNRKLANAPRDFGLYVCLNNDTDEVAICGYCGASKKFFDLIGKREFKPTHWWEKPNKDGELNL